MGRIILSYQPIIPRTAPLDHLKSFMGMTLSQAEGTSQGNFSTACGYPRALFQLKESLAALFLGFTGRDNTTTGANKTWNAFRLTTNEDSNLLIFVSALRHDRDSGSICLDAYAVFLTTDRIRRMSSSLEKLARGNGLISIRVTEGEQLLWKQILPALVERCRFFWDHMATCAYEKKPFTCPRSILHGQMPICSCGEGKEAQRMPSEYAGLRSYATRVAVPPLSAVPFVEPMAFVSALSSLKQK